MPKGAEGTAYLRARARAGANEGEKTVNALQTKLHPATDPAVRTCRRCRYFILGRCEHAAWQDWPQRDGDELACSEYENPIERTS